MKGKGNDAWGAKGSVDFGRTSGREKERAGINNF